MKVFAIGDLHLSFAEKVMPGKWNQVKKYKPMNIFGEQWESHYQKLYANWGKLVSNNDLVLIPGDISWATDLEETKFDFDYIYQLPGKKVLIKGNHDYWWKSISKLRSNLGESTYAIQNDSLKFNNISITGTRGWYCPSSLQFKENDLKIYKREVLRLEMSLKSVEKRGKKLITLFHFMPTNEKHEKNELIELLIKYKVDICLYAHLHGQEIHETRLEGEKWGINFNLVSSDFLKFKPKMILSKIF